MSPSPSPFRALVHYRELPEHFGLHQMLISLFARSPYAMLPLGIMTAFSASTGDIAKGGLATGIFSVASAICSPLIGRASDYWGQRGLLLALIPLNALGILGLYWAALSGASGMALWLLCFATGATVVPVGSFTRARWVARNPNPRILNAAFSYESMADELVFVLGPALVGIAASAATPPTALLLAFALAVVAGIPFALGAPKHVLSSPEAKEGKRPRIRAVIAAVLPTIFALVAVGVYFGSVQAATTARAEGFGEAGAAGLIYATMGIGSAVAALLVVTLPAGFKLSARFVVFGIGMSATIFITSFDFGLPMTALLLLLSGLFVGPTLVTAFTISEKLAPPGGIAVAMTLMQSSVIIGVSVGAAVGGAIAEGAGAAPTYLFSSVPGLVVAAVGGVLLLPRCQRRHRMV